MTILEALPYIYDRFVLFILILTRISALFSTFMVFRRDLINARIIISLSVILSIFVLMLSPQPLFHLELMSIQMLTLDLFQFFIGFMAGLILNIVFEIFVGFGQIVSMQIGISLASLFDPKLGNITSLTKFYMFCVTLIFFFLNGHLFIIKTILDSFTIIPLTQKFIPTHLISDVLKYSSIIFSGSVLLSITIIISMILANFALSVMSKFAPQFNLFSIGVNLTLVFGLLFLCLTFDLFVNRSSTFMEDGLHFLKITLGK